MTTPAGALPRKFHLLSCAAYTLLCVAWTWWAGKDQNWDLLNYHLYVAQAWWQGRLPEELFAAGPQSYLNPLAHLPFFFLIKTGWHSLVVGSLMAILHSTNLWLLHAITARLLPYEAPARPVLIVGAVLFGGLGPAFLLETGTSYIDVLVSIPLLAGLLLALTWHQLIKAKTEAGYRRLWIAFFLAGFAVGLKPTAVTFAVSIGVSLLLTNVRRSGSILWRAITAGTLGALISAGAHALKLWSAFGNPFFPMMNGVFKSPFYPTSVRLISRFGPDSLQDALAYPFRLLDAFERAGLEDVATDIRPALLILLLATHAIRQLLDRKWAVRMAATEALPPFSPYLICLSLAYILWLSSSANLRYGIEVFLLLGPAAVLAILLLRITNRIAFLLLLALPFTVQAIFATTLNVGRTSALPWTREWIAINTPQRLREQPAWYLSLQMQPYAMLALHVSPNSRFTNLVGQNTLDPRGVAWQRVLETRARLNLPLRSLVWLGPHVYADGSLPTTALAEQRSLLSEYGLSVQESDCEWIDLNGADQPPLHWQERASEIQNFAVTQRSALLSCLLTEGPPIDKSEQENRRRIDARFDYWEVRCPKDFHNGVSSVQGPLLRWRQYGALDSVLYYSPKGGLRATKLWTNANLKLEDRHGKIMIDGCPDFRRAKFGQTEPSP